MPLACVLIIPSSIWATFGIISVRLVYIIMAIVVGSFVDMPILTIVFLHERG